MDDVGDRAGEFKGEFPVTPAIKLAVNEAGLNLSLALGPELPLSLSLSPPPVVPESEV